MKNIQKLVLPALIILVLAIIYIFYFASSENLGAFADLDPNNSAVKDVKVKYLPDRGINQQGGSVVFFVSDKNGLVMQVFGEFQVPEGIQDAETIIVRGHLSGGNFHAHEVLLD